MLEISETVELYVLLEPSIILSLSSSSSIIRTDVSSLTLLASQELFLLCAGPFIILIAITIIRATIIRAIRKQF